MHKVLNNVADCFEQVALWLVDHGLKAFRLIADIGFRIQTYKPIFIPPNLFYKINNFLFYGKVYIFDLKPTIMAKQDSFFNLSQLADKSVLEGKSKGTLYNKLNTTLLTGSPDLLQAKEIDAIIRTVEKESRMFIMKMRKIQSKQKTA